MESFVMYLFRSVIWLTGFSLVYLIFLRSERFFRLKRYYLIAGIVISLVLPLITINYRVELPAPDAGLAGLVSDPIPEAQTLIQQDTGTDTRSGATVLLFIYLAGILFCLLRIVRHLVILTGVIRKSDIAEKEGFKLVRANEFRNSFSFFSYIFINPGVNKDEAEVILNHELVHVSQRHWFDLLLTEIMKMLQWVNPFAWIYSGFIKQNHEYLADERALQLAVDPASYKAALVNQLFQAPVFSLTDSFSYSLNRSRFAMMKKVVVSPYRKLRVFFILPVAALILMAFAKPVYNYIGSDPSPAVMVSDSGSMVQVLRGVVFSEDGNPLRGATILVPGTNAGVVTGDDGSFTMENVPSDAVIVISAKGYLSKMEKLRVAEPLKITLQKDPDYREPEETITTTDWPPSSSLIVIDGVIKESMTISDVDARKILSVTVLNEEKGLSKYGEKGKNGVLEFTMRQEGEVPQPPQVSSSADRSDPANSPTFEGERFGSFDRWVNSRVKYPEGARARKAEGWVQVNFTIEGDGTIKDIKPGMQSDNELYEAVASVVRSAPAWEPAKNPAARLPVQGSVSVRFRLPDQILTEAPFVVVEEMPMFPNGDKALLEYLNANVRYPEEAKAAGIEGRVIVRFIVSRSGKVEGITVLKGVDPLLDAEAVRLVGTLPDFSPGKQAGKAVDVWYMVPVTFSLGTGPEATEKSVPPPPPPPPASLDEEPFVVVEEMPEYPGGDIALLQFVNENTNYPAEAKTQNIQGRVIVRFAVTKDGNVTNITALKGVHPLLDAEAIRVVSLLKGFKPGMQGGKAVNVWYMLPVTFTLK
ncbi:MAG: TonB family protein [Bacteroidales bacterium]|jgi:TonB family protein|nr:TonB family protein [Bacteroidales bacterium]